MGKRRVIDSKIRVSQSFSRLTYRQRDLWQGLIATADDQGRQPGQAAYVRSAIWPYDDIALSEVETDLCALEAANYIVRYAVEDNIYLQIVNWWKYQQAQWMSPSDYPPPEGWIDRTRYHGKGNAIITSNWEQAGGFLSSVLDSGQDRRQGSKQDTDTTNPPILPREEGEGEGEGEGEDEGSSPSSSPSFPIPEWIPETPIEAKGHPGIQVFEQVTGRVPGARDYKPVIETVRHLARNRSPDELVDYLAPFWLAWSGRRTRDGRPYAPGNIAWLTEWAVNDEIPPNDGNQPQGHSSLTELGFEYFGS
ncbi:MAG TPA: hypothetical protein PKD55_10765 [Bellilinea sp.]|nr:hypothetical protein [Bellilinea sp.]